MEIDGKKVEAKRPVKESNVTCCRACLATDCKLYNMHEHNLVAEFVRVSGFDVIETGKFPKYLCVWCTSLLRRCAAFRDKCRRATKCLLPELRKGDLIVDSIRVIDRYTNKLVNLMQTEVEITDSLDIPVMLQDQLLMYDLDDKLDAMKQLDYKKRRKKEDEPVIKGNNKPKNDLYLQIDSADMHGIKINVVNDNILPKETISETITEDMFDTEYLDDFENVSISRFTKINPDVNKSVELDCEIREESIGKAARGNHVPRFRSAQSFKEFETTCNVDFKELTQAEQLAEIESQRNSTSYKEALYQCHPCGRHFKFKDTLDRHLAKHNKEAGDHECPVCTLRHLSKAALISHIEHKHHFKITCKECGLVFTTKFKARQHHEWHNGTKFKCDYCGKVFDNVSTCFSHIRLVHPTMNKACNMCGETFINDKGLNWHKTRAHGVPSKEKHLICKTCSVKFISFDALEKHKDTAGADANLTPCIQCGENFDSEEKMQEHSMSEHPVCKECNMTFITDASYNTHVLRKHQGLGRPGDKLSVFPRPPQSRPPGYKSQQSQPVPACCEQCGKMFRCLAFLRQHQMSSHEGIKPFACNICQKKFGMKFNLYLHLRAHKGERPHQCPHCPLAFTLKGNLIRHHKTAHLNIRESFPCPICGRGLSTRASVRVHIKEVHHGDRPKRIRKRRHEKAPPTPRSPLAPTHGGDRPKRIRKRRHEKAPPTPRSPLAPTHGGDRPKRNRKRRHNNAPSSPASPASPASPISLVSPASPASPVSPVHYGSEE